MDQQVTEQYLKQLKRYSMVSLWVDLICTLCQHLATSVYAVFQVIGIMVRTSDITQKQVGLLQISAETPASQSPACTAAPAPSAGLPFAYI